VQKGVVLVTEPSRPATDQLIDGLARHIRRRRLETPAVALLEVSRPLSFLASQGLLVAQPLLGFLFGESQVGGYADLFADRANVDRLIARLDPVEMATCDSGEEFD
jgi:hypothetical protein